MYINILYNGSSCAKNGNGMRLRLNALKEYLYDIK